MMPPRVVRDGVSFGPEGRLKAYPGAKAPPCWRGGSARAKSLAYLEAKARARAKASAEARAKTKCGDSSPFAPLRVRMTACRVVSETGLYERCATWRTAVIPNATVPSILAKDAKMDGAPEPLRTVRISDALH